MKKKWSVFAAITLVLVLLTGQVVLAQDGDTEVEDENTSGGTVVLEAGADVANYFPVQGRLTNAAGTPLDGNYSMVFRLYDVLSGGTALCSDTNSVTVTKGLFSTEVWGNCAGQMNGKQLYLSIQVGSDPEMSPRQPIYAVPYAWSLRPNSDIIGSVGPGAILDIENSDPAGRGLRSYATDATGVNYGIVGASSSVNGYGGYYYNNGGGTGLYSSSDTGTAFVAAGTGIIKSSAQSSVWISGNGVRPYRTSDTTVIDLDSIGGAKIYPGTSVTFKNVMLPITLPGPLYGQNVKIVGMDVYFQSAGEFDGIVTILLRRQTGACASCYLNILYDTVDHICDVANNATGCILHYNLTANNTLTSSSGILYLTFELGFGGSGTWVDIGGVRLVLEHD